MQRGFCGERLAGGSTTACTPTINMHFVRCGPSRSAHCTAVVGIRSSRPFNKCMPLIIQAHFQRHGIDQKRFEA
eukprot:scaffold242067_cov41-Prasinocladus_malaysianus.AAC.1